MKLFRPISSVLLAMLVLVASSSFYVGVHICGDTVKAVAFLEEADGCGHQSLPPCHRQLMKGCCENETIQHNAQDFKADNSVIQLQAVLAFEIETPPVLISEIIPSNYIPSFSFTDYDPPIKVTDITVDLQVFLI